MPGVHDQHQAVQTEALRQVSREDQLPVLAHGLRYLGVAVAGKVDQVAVLPQAEEIDQLRASWGAADECQLKPGGCDSRAC